VRHAAIWNIIFAFSMANMPSLFTVFLPLYYCAIKIAEEMRCLDEMSKFSRVVLNQ
jgi:hypothetical protein